MIDRRHFLKLSGKAAGAAMLAATATRANAADTSAPSPDDPAWLSATELLSRFRNHQLSPADVLEAQIKRIGTYEDRVRCITVKHFDEARAAARESEARYRAGNPRPLEGITVAVKDEFAVKGWTTTMGSLLLKDAPPDKADNPVIERLRAAGAVFHVQTTVPEFYTWLTTATKLWGVTRNPWNLAYTPGGSSGGAGAALAAGFTTLALGSDMGGSIRIPASQCGVYGFKPPFGRVPTSEVPYETEGPLARTFDDLNLFANAMAGPHPLVLTSLRPKLDYPAHYASVKGWKVAYDPMPGISPLEPSVQEAMHRAIDRLKSLGVTVDTVDLGFKADDLDTFWAGLFSTSMGGMRTEALKHPDLLMPYTRASFMRMQKQTGPDALVATEELLNNYQRRVQEAVFTRGYRALLAPTVATPLIPAEHGLNPETDSVTIQGRKVTGLKFVFTWVWNLLGAYPVVAAPIGLGDEGMPMGMQIVGNTYEDLDAFQLASAYSRVAPPLFTGNLFPDFRNQKA
jgi:amidase